MRAAIYARYSSDAQSATSIDDQVRLASVRAAREGWQIVQTLSDEATSGSVPVHLRPGGRRLLELVLGRQVDVLVIESLDRLSRDTLDQERVVRSLEHRGVRILGLSDGYDSAAKGKTLVRGVRGLINTIYLEDLAYKTHRGLAGQMARGFSAGGRAYGYTTVAADGGRRIVVDEAQAEVVRWIFTRYADGHSPRAIAHELNARGIKSARGGPWAVSALIGPKGKGLGLLHNELYTGRVLWNRRQWLKDPDTGARRYVERPRTEWQEREDPALRIVPDELWRRVQARGRAPAPRGTREGRGAVPRTLFGGLLRCALCGGPVVAVDARMYGCHAHKDRGPTECAGVSVRRVDLERRLLAEVRAELLSPAAIAELHTTVRRLAGAITRQQQAAGTDTPARRLQALQGEIDRLVDAVATAGLSGALRARLAAAEAEQAELQHQLRRAPPTPPDAAQLASEAISRWRGKVMDLQAALDSQKADPAERDRTRQILADLLGEVTVGRDASTGEAWADLEEPAERLLIAAAGGAPLGVVAGVRNSSRRRVRLG